MAQVFATRNPTHRAGAPVSPGFPQHRLPVFDWS